jgi:hypothetical protein
LARPVIVQNKNQLLEKWLKENKVSFRRSHRLSQQADM